MQVEVRCAAERGRRGLLEGIRRGGGEVLMGMREKVDDGKENVGKVVRNN